MFHKQYVSFPTRLFGLMVHKQTFAIFAKIFAFFVDSALSQNWTHAAGTTLSSAEGVVVQLWFRLSAVRSSAEILRQQIVTHYILYITVIDYYFITFLLLIADNNTYIGKTLLAMTNICFMNKRWIITKIAKIYGNVMRFND